MVSPTRRRNSRDRHKRRSRSRSRERKRYDDRRSRSRSRDRARRHRSRSPRYRSRSPRHRSYENHRSRERERERDREKSKDRKAQTSKHQPPYAVPATKNDAINNTDLSTEEREMMKMMGFCTFDTTKGKKVDGNDVGAVHVILKRKYRQYMNRKGGFNRPLDFVA